MAGYFPDSPPTHHRGRELRMCVSNSVVFQEPESEEGFWSRTLGTQFDLCQGPRPSHCAYSGLVVPPSSCHVSKIHPGKLSVPVPGAFPLKSRLKSLLFFLTQPTYQHPAMAGLGPSPRPSIRKQSLFLNTKANTKANTCLRVPGPGGRRLDFPERQRGSSWSPQGASTM